MPAMRLDLKIFSRQSRTNESLRLASHKAAPMVGWLAMCLATHGLVLGPGASLRQLPAAHRCLGARLAATEAPVTYAEYMAIRQSASYEAYVTNLAEDCELGDDVACDTVSSEDQAKAAWLETVAGSWGSAQTLSEAPVYTGETKKMEYEMEAKAPFDLTDALSNFRREDLSDALSGATSTVTGATKKLVENRGPFASELTSELAGATKSFTKKLVDLRAPLSQPAKTALNATVGLLKNVGMSVVMSEVCDAAIPADAYLA